MKNILYFDYTCRCVSITTDFKIFITRNLTFIIFRINTSIIILNIIFIITLINIFINIIFIIYFIINIINIFIQLIIIILFIIKINIFNLLNIINFNINNTSYIIAKCACMTTSISTSISTTMRWHCKFSTKITNSASDLRKFKII